MTATSPAKRTINRRQRADPTRLWRRAGTAESGFRYLRADGKPLRGESSLARIRKLAPPPARAAVRISPDPRAKIQASGRDEAGRQQYRYHPDHVARGSRRKYHKLLEYARALPRLRAATEVHLRRRGVGRERVLATVV